MSLRLLFLTVFLFTGAFLVKGEVAYGAVYEQLDYSTQASDSSGFSGSGGAWFQNLGTGLTGSVGQVSIAVEYTDLTGATAPQISIAEFTGIGTGYVAQWFCTGATPTLGMNFITCDFTSSGITLNPSNYYFISPYMNGGVNEWLGSSDPNSYPSGEALNNSFVNSTAIQPIKDFAFTMNSSFPPEDDSTRFISISPSNGTTTASTTVELSAVIYFNDTDPNAPYMQQVCVDIFNLEYQIRNVQFQPNDTRYCMDVLASGESSVSTTVTLPKGYYSADWYFTNPTDLNNDVKFLYQTVEFVVVNSVTKTWDDWSSSASSTIPVEECTWDFTSMKSWVCNLQTAFMFPIKLLFYPTNESVQKFSYLNTSLDNKFPFAYLEEVKVLRNELFDATQTGTTTINLRFKIIPGAGTSTLQLLSKQKLEAVPYASTVKTILGWLLWLQALGYIYYRVLRSHDSNTPS